MGERKSQSISQVEHDPVFPETKRVLLYGWDGSQKVRLKTSAAGVLETSASLSAAASQEVTSANSSSLKAQVFQGTDPWVVSFDASNPFSVVQASAASLRATVVVESIAAGDNNIGNVDIVSLPGDVEADIDQIRDQIDLITPDIEEIRADADAIRVAVEALDNAVSGNEMQVDVITLPAIPAGNNNIGDVDVASIAAGTATIGTVYTRPDALNLGASLSAVTPKFAVINAAAVGDTCIVPAVASKRILVLEYAFVVGTGGDGVTFKQGTTAVTGQMRVAANGGVAAPYSPVGLFVTASGASLYVNSSLGSQISGHLVYIEV